MSFFLLILGFILIKGISFYGKDEFNREGYISKSQTKCFEGFFVILVVLNHFNNDYIVPGVYDKAYIAFHDHMGQAIVAMFLFYSGYGMMTGIKRNGRNYIKTIPIRFINLLIQFDIAVIIYIVWRAINGTTFTLSHYLLSLTGWLSVGNSNWFIFLTLVLYICLFAAFVPLLLTDKNANLHLYASLFIFSALTFVYIVIMSCVGKESYWYDTAICFPAGAWFCVFKSKIEDIFMHSGTRYLVLLMLLVSAYTIFAVLKNSRFLYYEIWMLLFVSLFVVLSMKVSIKSTVLSFFGDHIFSIYILQRLPMMAFSSMKILAEHQYATLILVFTVTIVLSIVFDRLTASLRVNKNK